MNIMANHYVALALSNRNGNFKYSLTFKPETVKLIKARGISKFKILDRKSKCNLATLQPCDDNDKDGYTFQLRTSGHAHMEFPCELTKKKPVGVEGKACKTELRIFASGPIQLRRPTDRDIINAMTQKLDKEFAASGIAILSKKVIKNMNDKNNPQLKLVL